MKRANTSTIVGPDLISSLPDPILHHILGFLDTNAVVKTCVLSKRWENLWVSVRNLHFNFEDFVELNPLNEVEGQSDRYSQMFVKYVNAVIHRREPLDLDVFCLFCDYLEMDEQVSDWINYAVKHHTRVLRFQYCFSLPSCIFTSTSIVELYLYYCDLVISGTVNLPMLKKLVMDTLENASSSENLLSGCPILECLELENYFSSDCVIALEHLKHLKIINCIFDSLWIDAPNLLSFSYCQCLDKIIGPTPPYESILNMPSLVFASIQTGDFRMSEHWEAVTSILGSVSNVVFLNLQFSANQLQDLCRLHLSELPIYHKVKHVTVVFDTIACFQILVWILKMSPNLKKLTLEEDSDSGNFHQWEVGTSLSTYESLTDAISSCKELDMIEVRYRNSSGMVEQFGRALLNGSRELLGMKIQFILV